jgi:hypothetical protein
MGIQTDLLSDVWAASFNAAVSQATVVYSASLYVAAANPVRVGGCQPAV